MGRGYGAWLWGVVMGLGYGVWLWGVVMGHGAHTTAHRAKEGLPHTHTHTHDHQWGGGELTARHERHTQREVTVETTPPQRF